MFFFCLNKEIIITYCSSQRNETPFFFIRICFFKNINAEICAILRLEYFKNKPDNEISKRIPYNRFYLNQIRLFLSLNGKKGNKDSTDCMLHANNTSQEARHIRLKRPTMFLHI